MRVLHLAAGNMYGGVESMLVTMARAAAAVPALDAEYAVCHEGRLADELRAAGAVVHQLPAVRVSRPLGVLRARARLRALLRREAFDVVLVHSSWLQAVFGGATRAAGARVVVFQHGPAAGHHWTERMARQHQPDLVIANSEFTRRTAPVLYPRTPSSVVHCPVEDRASAHHAARAAVRRELGAPDDAFVVAFTGRVERWKGQLVLLDALAALDQHAADWRLWMTSGARTSEETAYLAEIEARIGALGVGDRVRLLGERRDVPRLLAGADAYCQPNLQPEAFGISFVEAMYAGLPVVGSALGGTLEVIDERSGYLVPPGDVPAVTRALAALAADADARHRMGAHGRERARALAEPVRQLERLCAQLAGVRNHQLAGS